MIRAVIISHDSFVAKVEFATQAEMGAFLYGFDMGARPYGGNYSEVCTLEDAERLEKNGSVFDRRVANVIRETLGAIV
jgi:hypothetical protein